MKELITRFLLRWTVNTVGIWMATQLITSVNFNDDPWVLVLTGLILSIVNALLKPLLTVVSLPFIALSLGLFTVVVNGAMVWLVSVIFGPFTTGGFTGAVLAGLIIGLVNYVLTILLDRE